MSEFPKKKADISFPDPKDGPGVDLLVIAGEHSGDEHAARLVKSAKLKNPSLRVAAIGGRHVEKAGAELLFDLVRFSVVGFVEVIRTLKDQFRIRDEILRWVKTHRPKVICFVDYPGLNLRVAKALFDLGLTKKSGGDISLLFYISPQVWAWKAKRKYKMAEYLDSLAVIFPFEVEVFDDTGLDTRFVGHPFLAEDFDLPVSYAPEGPVLILPGSRTAAVGRIAPVLFRAFEERLKSKQKLSAVCVYASKMLKEQLEDILSKYPVLKGHVSLIANETNVKASAVLTSSGTMSLKCALASIPGAVAYRTHPFTYYLGRILVKIKFIGIANLLLNKPLYPEYIQGAATAKALAHELSESMESVERIKQTRRWSAELRELLDQPSRGGVADWVLEHLEKGN
ncbi:lipid-A-disaccharide synthase [Puniceicoccaceae bacterium K14]|nr:lipid-A-disaccharide synthase [Puniceicoccaceae bacterium K14]